jgi:hypothetical protein
MWCDGRDTERGAPPSCGEKAGGPARSAYNGCFRKVEIFLPKGRLCDLIFRNELNGSDDRPYQAKQQILGPRACEIAETATKKSRTDMSANPLKSLNSDEGMKGNSSNPTRNSSQSRQRFKGFSGNSRKSARDTPTGSRIVDRVETNES